MTPQDFINLFEQRVKEYEQEFFFNGARQLLDDLKQRGLDCSSQDIANAVNAVLRDGLLETRKDPGNPPAINDVRVQLKKALGI